MKPICSKVCLLVFLVAALPQWLPAQTDWLGKAKAAWGKEDFELANTASAAAGLSDEEKTLYLLTNLARLNGEKFHEELVVAYLMETQTPSSTNTKSLKTDLAKIKDLPMLKVEDQLCKSAAYHATDMGKTGGVSHDSSDGTKCFDRIEKYFNKPVAMAENCSYGYSKAMDILMQLLIDEGVPSLGHRKNILSPAYQVVGLSIQRHKTYQWNCVMDFAGG